MRPTILRRSLRGAVFVWANYTPLAVALVTLGIDIRPISHRRRGEMPDEQNGQGETPNPQGEKPAELNFDEWMSTQPEPVQNLLDKHTGGLRSALESERNAAKSLAKQVRELSSKLDANSEAGRQLAELSGKLETEQRRADFVQEAAAAGCRDLRLAWLAANADGLTLKQVQQQHPDLFAAPRPPATHAGNGAAAAGGAAPRDMNLFIRRAAGRS